MPIKGYQGTSLLDFPGRIASLVFFSGCNLSCPFCHNPDLLFDVDQLPDIPPDDLLADLQTRRNFIDGVVVTGGEPTLDPELEPFLRQVKELGLLTKLDTNGLAPLVLERLLGD
ncbi:MAG TPA: radical SAM protein, partial [Geothermobacteraceae bacterium]|nr:radical SAM protein [Geothermobacteraceae bacterium]